MDPVQKKTHSRFNPRTADSLPDTMGPVQKKHTADSLPDTMGPVQKNSHSHGSQGLGLEPNKDLTRTYKD